MTEKRPLPDDWMQWAGDIFQQPELQRLRAFLRQRRQQGAIIYPPTGQWFNAFWQTPISRLRVVILGQDPYHGPGQAQGLSFSVPPGVEIPPSLRNIFQEQQQDLGIPPAAHGCLLHWAQQGVLLLNAVLTVEQGQAGAHRNQGWETFTNHMISQISRHAAPCVFLLWGSDARQKKALIDPQRHLILEAPHPSPLSAYRGFLGCRHFSRANAWLEQQGQGGIDWALPAAAG